MTVRSACAAFTLLGVASCTPVQFGANQCRDVNVNVTEFKDADLVAAMPAAVDAIVAQALAGSDVPEGTEGPFVGDDPIRGCAVGVMDDDQPFAVKGYGMAAANRPFTHFTPAVVGSISKTWTALAALRLVELGLLNLDDTVSDVLFFVPPAFADLTVEQLLSHTSGLQREPLFSPNLDTAAELSAALFPSQPVNDQIGIHPSLVYYSFLQTPAPGFDQGSTARYSNAGYMLLGALVDRVVQENEDEVGEEFASYESFAWRDVGLFDGTLSGDQMTSQCLNEEWRQNDIANLARGFEWDGSGFDQVTHANSPTLQFGPFGWEGPAGAWAMTIGDLTRFMAALQNDDIVEDGTFDDMLDVRGSDSSGNWGLGFNLITKFNRPVYMHDGAYPGFRARYTVWPNEGVGVAVMCNGSDANMRDLTDEIAEALFFGGSGIGGAGVAQAASTSTGRTRSASLTPVVDEDDPPLGAALARRNDRLDLTRGQRRELARDYVSLKRTQAKLSRRYDALERRFSARGCPAALARLERSEPEAARRLAECAAAPNAGRFTACVRRATEELRRAGGIGRGHAAQINRCALFADQQITLKRPNSDF